MSLKWLWTSLWLDMFHHAAASTPYDFWFIMPSNIVTKHLINLTDPLVTTNIRCALMCQPFNVFWIHTGCKCTWTPVLKENIDKHCWFCIWTCREQITSLHDSLEHHCGSYHQVCVCVFWAHCTSHHGLFPIVTTHLCLLSHLMLDDMTYSAHNPVMSHSHLWKP